jgi:hypothetical protein
MHKEFEQPSDSKAVDTLHRQIMSGALRINDQDAAKLVQAAEHAKEENRKDLERDVEDSKYGRDASWQR